MKKTTFAIFVIVIAVVAISCGKKDKDRDEYLKYEHQVKVPIEEPSSTPMPTTTPTLEITTDQIMNSFHREENVIETRIEVIVGMAYDEPYDGKPLGYLVGEDFTTEDFYWADHNNRVGFKLSSTKGLFEADDRGIIHPIEVNDSDGIIWIDDSSVIFSLVPHPEAYDMSDWGY